MLPDRSRVLVTWTDTRVAPAAVYAQWLDAAGNRIGTNFQVSSASWLTTPCCAVASEQDWFVVWEDSRARDQDIYGYHPARNESRVNDDFASAIQDFPCVGISQNGEALTVWYDERHGSADADIYGQRFDNLGNRIGANFRINDDGAGNQQHFPWILSSRSGAAVVVWRDTRLGNYTVYGQRYDPSGTPAGSNFWACESTGPGWPSYIPHGAMNQAGDFLVSWSQPSGAYCQLYRADGTMIGSNRRLAPDGTWPAVWLAEDCSYWAAWYTLNQVWLGRFDSLGLPLIPARLVTQVPGPGAPALTRDPQGTIWLGWVDSRSGAAEVYGRRFLSSGEPLGSEFKINDDNIPCEHLFPCWAYDSSHVYVTFTDFRIEGNLNIMAQIFAMNGERLGPNFAVNTDPNGLDHQWAYQTVAGADSYVAYCWEDNRNLRSWDIYFKLLDRPAVSEQPPPWVFDVRPEPSVIRSGARLDVWLTESDRPTSIRLLDRQGSVVRELRTTGAGRRSLDCRDLSTGVYFLVVEPGEPAARKVVVLK
jgi:hypothetical protein